MKKSRKIKLFSSAFNRSRLLLPRQWKFFLFCRRNQKDARNGIHFPDEAVFMF